MSVLKDEESNTFEELKSLRNRVYEAEISLYKASTNQETVQEELQEANKLTKIYFIGFVLSIILLIVGVGIIFVAPSFIKEKEIEIAENQIIVRKSEIEFYKSTISKLENSLADQSTSHPLDLDQFYAVQLAAFKEVNTPLSSDEYSIVKNANFKDFNLFTLGVFRTKAEAEKLLKVVNKLNLKDVFIGNYRNGERVDM